MILKLKNILSNSKNTDKDEITSSSKNIAAAALLIEAACIDGKLDSEEQKIINTKKSLAKHNKNWGNPSET